MFGYKGSGRPGLALLVLVLVSALGRDVGAEASVGDGRQTPAGQRFNNNEILPPMLPLRSRFHRTFT